jgi:hypothetical protein
VPSRWRLCGAFILALISSWLNIGIVVVSAPLFAILAAVQRSRNYATLFAISLGAFALESAHSRQYGRADYHSIAIFPYQQIAGLRTAVQASINPTAFMVAVLVLAALLIMASPVRRAGAWRFGQLLLACVVSMLLTGASYWFMTNDYHLRYISLPLMLAIGGTGIWIVQLVYEVLKENARSLMTPAMTLIAAALCVHAVQPHLPLALIGPSAKILAARAVQGNIHLIAGDYWTTWPAVFEAVRLRRTDDTYGLTSRGEVMLDEIRTSMVRNPRVLCVTPAPDNCRHLIGTFVGSDSYRGKMLIESLTAIETNENPHSVLYELR